MILKRNTLGFAVESACVFFMFILLFAYTHLDNYGTLGTILKILGILGLLGFFIGLFMPDWADLAALGVGFVISILALAIFIPDIFSPYITYNAIIFVGGILC